MKRLSSSLARIAFWSAVLAVALLPARAALHAAPAASDPVRAEEVREAMLGLYIHGVTDDLAAQILNPTDIPYLLTLLGDRDFPRRDNIIAFLAHLDDGRATGAIERFLMDPPADVDRPEELRSLHLAPQALGRIAARGDPLALEALLELTDEGGDRGRLVQGALRSSRPEQRRADVVEMGIRGLALSGSSVARRRLVGIRDRIIRLQSDGRSLEESAVKNLELFDRRSGGGAPLSSPISGLSPAPLAGPVAMSPLSGGPSQAQSGPPQGVFDTAGFVHNSALTYSNHSSVPQPMDNSRLDMVLRQSNLKAAREDFAGDVACCITVGRQGNAQNFIQAGADIIDSDPELSSVLSNPISRVKVVNTINYCSGPGSNILGCAWVGGWGMAVVRMSTVQEEAVLWLHEFGHNTGLNHHGDNTYVMYGFLSAGAGGLDSADCAQYHSPNDGTSPTSTGQCLDSDVDGIHDGADNCPFQSNPLQIDTDGDGQGDDCDGDADSDGFEDPNDCRPLDNQVWETPGEATDLTLVHQPVGTVLTWTAPGITGGSAASIRYDVLQSDMATGFTTPDCVENNEGPDASASTSSPLNDIWTTGGGIANAEFGSSVASAGDVNGDGFSDIIVGSPRFFSGQDQEGRAYVYHGSGLGPVGAADWNAESDSDLAHFGAAVASAGDINNDGFDDVIVGAPDMFEPSFNGGAFVYDGSPSGLSTSWSWGVGSPTGFFSDFGFSVASAGDVNNDGFDDVIVGEPLLNAGMLQQGGAYVYHGSGSGLSTTPAWTPVGAAAGSKFGTSVASAGDVNNDGFDDVIVGAPDETNGETGEGRAYVYLGSMSGLSLTPHAVLEIDNTQAEFGISVASAGDVNGDGYDDILVGARLYTGDLSNEGGAFLFPGSASGVITTPAWEVEGDQTGSWFGYSVSSAGDINHDGFDDVVIGARNWDNGLNNIGRFSVYLGSESGLAPVAVYVQEGDQAGGQLGHSVAFAGDVNGDLLSDFVVGSRLYDTSLSNAGIAQVFEGQQGNDPPLNGIFYFAIRPRNVCGTGPFGFDSIGAPRPAGFCP